METQAGEQWHPTASCPWPAQRWGQGWGVGRAAGSFLQQGPGGCWGEGAVGQESGLAGNLGKLPAVLCLSFPFICEIKGWDSTVVFRSHGVLFTAAERGLGNQTRRALAPSCLPSSGLGQVSLFSPRKEMQWCSRKGATQSGLCGSVGAPVGIRAVLGHPPSRSPSGCMFTSGAVSPYEASLPIGRTGLNRPTSE